VLPLPATAVGLPGSSEPFAFSVCTKTPLYGSDYNILLHLSFLTSVGRRDYIRSQHGPKQAVGGIVHHKDAGADDRVEAGDDKRTDEGRATRVEVEDRGRCPLSVVCIILPSYNNRSLLHNFRQMCKIRTKVQRRATSIDSRLHVFIRRPRRATRGPVEAHRGVQEHSLARAGTQEMGEAVILRFTPNPKVRDTPTSADGVEICAGES
jgi:hypothetical protein